MPARRSPFDPLFDFRAICVIPIMMRCVWAMAIVLSCSEGALMAQNSQPTAEELQKATDLATKQAEILRWLTRERRGLFGMNARPLHPARIALGDPVSVR